MFNFKKIFFIFDYYLAKVKARAFALFLLKFKNFKSIERFLYFRLPKDFNFSRKIIFCFWDPDIVHLGDQLFYEPLIEYLDKRFEVLVLTYPLMLPYFKSLGYNVSEIGEIRAREIKGAVLLTNKDMLYRVSKKFGKDNLILAVDYAATRELKRIVRLIFEKITGFLNRQGILEQAADSSSLCPRVSEQLIRAHKNEPWLNIFSKDKKFIVFNNYVFSRFLALDKEKAAILENLAREKKNQGYLIVHIGSKKDKETDLRKYDFVDYDLRGETKPLALFKLFSLDNVEAVIAFDTFAMHAASMLGKDLYIVLRSRESREMDEIFKKSFTPMAESLEGLIKFLA